MAKGTIVMERAEAAQRKKETKEMAEIQNPEDHYQGRWSGPEWTVIEILEDVFIGNDCIFWEGETTIAKIMRRGGKQSWCAYNAREGRDEMIAYNVAAEVRISN
jgi:hypothetical protein